MARPAFNNRLPDVGDKLNVEKVWQLLVYNQEIRRNVKRKSQSIYNRITIAHHRYGANVPIGVKVELIDATDLFLVVEQPQYKLRGLTKQEPVKKQEKNYKL